MLVELPFTVGKYHGVKFEALRFVYRHGFYAFGRSSWDGCGVQFVVPVGEQVVDVARRVAAVFQQAVEEGHYVASLLGQCLQTEYAV